MQTDNQSKDKEEDMTAIVNVKKVEAPFGHFMQSQLPLKRRNLIVSIFNLILSQSIFINFLCCDEASTFFLEASQNTSIVLDCDISLLELE